MNKRPNIGVTGPDKGGLAAWLFTKSALMLQGARAIRIRPKDGIPRVDIHGLIIGGGADISPEHYNDKEIEDLFSKDEKISGIRQFFNRLATIFFFPLIYFIRKILSSSSAGIDKKRDRLEFKLLELALNKGIPVLGICRGAQLLNIHLGGTLHNDISNYYTEIPQVRSVWPKKKINIETGSKLHDIICHRQVWVNALHNQAIDRLGNNLEVVAREENGIVQAIEHKSNKLLLGVQWHPEYLPQIPQQRRIFKTLVDEARRFVDGFEKKL
jgi:putative glutamine amidotransferase